MNEQIKSTISPAIQRFALGGLGGLTLVLLDFVASDFRIVVEDANVYTLVGYSLRAFALMFIGGLNAFMYSDEFSRIKLFQLGIAMPALIAYMISATAVAVPGDREFASTAAIFEGFSPIPVANAVEPETEITTTGTKEQSSPGVELILGLTGRERPPKATIEDTLKPAFKLAFFSILGLTVMSALANLYLLGIANPAATVISSIESFSTTWKLGFGAIVGLIGGGTV